MSNRDSRWLRLRIAYVAATIAILVVLVVWMVLSLDLLRAISDGQKSHRDQIAALRGRVDGLESRLKSLEGPPAVEKPGTFLPIPP